MKKIKKALKKSAKKVLTETKPQKNNKLGITIIVLILIALVIAFIVIFKPKKTSDIDTSLTLSTITTNYIIVKDKDRKHEYKIPLKPAMAKSLGFPATPVTPEVTVTTQANKNVTTAITTTTQTEKKDFSYLFNPVDSKEKIHRIDIDAAKFLFDSGKAIFIDSRSITEYNQAHIKGAIPIPVNMIMDNIPKYKDKLKGKVLITYCHGIGCHLSDKVAYQLFDSGYRKICIFFGGWPKWNEYKYPITQNNP